MKIRFGNKLPDKGRKVAENMIDCNESKKLAAKGVGDKGGIRKKTRILRKGSVRRCVRKKTSSRGTKGGYKKKRKTASQNRDRGRAATSNNESIRGT